MDSCINYCEILHYNYDAEKQYATPDSFELKQNTQVIHITCKSYDAVLQQSSAYGRRVTTTCCFAADTWSICTIGSTTETQVDLETDVAKVTLKTQANTYEVPDIRK